MMKKTALYQYKDENISVDITAYFENGNLVIDGYDVGERVKELTGDSDYEYRMRISEKDLARFCAEIGTGIESGEDAILERMVMIFNINTCFSEIGSILRQSDIPFEYFSWR
jgi:hypothetical protein